MNKGYFRIGETVDNTLTVTRGICSVELGEIYEVKYSNGEMGIIRIISGFDSFTNQQVCERISQEYNRFSDKIFAKHILEYKGCTITEYGAAVKMEKATPIVTRLAELGTFNEKMLGQIALSVCKAIITFESKGAYSPYINCESIYVTPKGQIKIGGFEILAIRKAGYYTPYLPMSNYSSVVEFGNTIGALISMPNAVGDFSILKEIIETAKNGEYETITEVRNAIEGKLNELSDGNTSFPQKNNAFIQPRAYEPDFDKGLVIEQLDNSHYDNKAANSKVKKNRLLLWLSASVLTLALAFVAFKFGPQIIKFEDTPNNQLENETQASNSKSGLIAQNNKSDDYGSEESTDRIDDDQVVKNPYCISDLEWSKWSTKLPSNISAEENAIKMRLLYRSTEIVKVENGTAPGENYVKMSDRTEETEWVTEPSWTYDWRNETDYRKLVNTSGGEEIGNWSEWSTTWPGGEDKNNRTIVTAKWDYDTNSFKYIISGKADDYKRISNDKHWSSTPTQYSYKDVTYTSEQYLYATRIVTDYYYNSSWSEFSENLIKQNKDTLVTYKMEYSYAPSENGKISTEPSMLNFERFSDDFTNLFSDVDADSWYSPENSSAIRTAVKLGILLPEQFMTFNPDGHSTVGQVIRAAVMINRIYNGYSGLLGENDGTYEKYADYAVKNGIIYKDQYPDLNKDATRLDMATLFYRALPKAEYPAIKEIGPIVDSSDSESVKVLMAAGVVSYNKEQKFRPGDTITRAEIATMIDKIVYPEKRT